MGLEESDALKAFEVVIQSGAIFAVCLLYRRDLLGHLSGLVQKKKASVQFFLNIFLAFLPAAVLGLLFHSWIKEHLFSVGVVVSTLFLGGVIMIISERKFRQRDEKKALSSEHRELEHHKLSPKNAFVIGLFQCLAMIPGTSRSWSTILGARFQGLKPAAAAEFSFFLALPTLMGASVLDFYLNFDLLMKWNPLLLLVGTLVSFFVAVVVIKLFIAYLKSRSLEVFGWYRIAISLFMSALIWL